MAEEKSLLQQIREKELMISIKIDETRREAEEVIISARKEASEMIETSEREGKKTAQEYYEKEMEKLRKEVEQIRNQSNEEAILVRAEGERNLPAAIDKIAKVVSLE
ncbi:MAG: V-type ATPase subunit subunit G family protein [Methanoregula sp.]|nr:V-type ATPase subunit subunit G family protein [Methanoregula sp.]